MDLAQFKDFLASNKENEEVKSVLKGEFSNFLVSEDGLKSIQPLLDSHGSKVVEAFKLKGMEKEFEKRIDSEREKIKLELDPPKNPFEQRVIELEAKILKSDNEKAMLLVKEKALKQLKHKDLEGLLKITTDEEETIKRVNILNENVDKMIDEAVIARLKANTHVPGGADNDNGNNINNPFDPKTLNLTEQGRIFREDPEKARNLARQAGKTI